MALGVNTKPRFSAPDYSTRAPPPAATAGAVRKMAKQPPPSLRPTPRRGTKHAGVAEVIDENSETSLDFGIEALDCVGEATSGQDIGNRWGAKGFRRQPQLYYKKHH